MLFGTLPVFPCLKDDEDQKLLLRLRTAKNVTTRNDPDGRSRLNVNVFTGNVIVTDFGDETGTISNIQKDKLTDVFDKWLSSDLAKSLNCHCSEFSCLGPNVLVKICTIRIWILKIMSVICTNNHKLYNFKNA